MSLNILKVQVNGAEIKPASLHVYSSLYVCESCSAEEAEWFVEYQEGVSGMTDVVSF